MFAGRAVPGAATAGAGRTQCGYDADVLHLRRITELYGLGSPAAERAASECGQAAISASSGAALRPGRQGRSPAAPACPALARQLAVGGRRWRRHENQVQDKLVIHQRQIARDIDLNLVVAEALQTKMRSECG